MPRIPGLRRAFHLPARRAHLDDDVDAELAFHFQTTIEELMAGGASEDDARAEAMRRFGDLARTRRRLGAIDRARFASTRRAAWWASLWHDVRYAVRGLTTRPGFSAVVVLTLALGIGANAVMFGVIDRLLLQPPTGIQGADRVARVYFTAPDQSGGTFTSTIASYPKYEAVRDGTPSFDRVAAYWTTELTLGRGADAQKVTGTLATASFFPLLGVLPALGRFFTENEDRPPAGVPVVVLGYAFWQRQFGGDSAALGTALRIGDGSFTVIGVAPEGFTGVDLRPVDLWVPMSAAATSSFSSNWRESWGSYWLRIIGHLRPGATTELAGAQATAAFLHAQPTRVPDWDRKTTLSLGSVIASRGPGKSSEARVSFWLAGVSLIVLLIACANIANLLLARAMQRRREIAVRLALGIGRGRLARLLVMESVLLAGLGGVAALLVAYWGGAALRATLLPDIAWSGTPIDSRVLLFTGCATLITGLLAGMAPAVQASRPDVAQALKASAREGTFHRSRLRSSLLIVQAALSVMLLVGAGLFVRSLRNVHALDMGIDLHKVLVAHVDMTRSGYTGQEVQALYQRALERVQQMPGVEQASLASAAPFQGGYGGGLEVPGHETPSIPDGGPYVYPVTSGFFATLGSRIVRGRGFTEADDSPNAHVLIVNETMARLIWRGENPVGTCVRTDADGPCSEVIGVVQNMPRNRITGGESMLYFEPLAGASSYMKRRYLFVRAARDPMALAGAVRREMQSLAPDLPAVSVESYESIVDPQIRPWRLGATMFGAFGLLALAIAAVGLYSVIAYTVTQRTHELGVRMALGARAPDVLRLVVGQGLRVAVIGIALGSLAALAAGRAIASLLFDTSPRDPAVFVAVAVMLLVVSVAASLIPAWRATRVDPCIALRAE